VAWQAARRGLRVTVLERAVVGAGTSRVAAGMIAPVSEADASERELLRFGVDAAAGYPAFIDALRNSTERDPGYLRCGTLLVARDADEADALSRAERLRRELGLSVRRLVPSEARALEPALAPTVRLALDLADDHVIDPRALMAALADALESAGGTIRVGAEVTRLLRGASGVEGVELAGGERVPCGQVVIAAGVWSSRLAGLPDGEGFSSRPVKGQILRLHDPAGPGLLTRVLRLERGYIVPRGDGRYVIGATMEERGFDTTVTAGAVFELLRDAAELVPGISELVIDELSAGLRPGTPDNSPVIGPGSVPGLHWATGHYRGGILFAPLTGRLVAAALSGDPYPEDLAPFAPSRFARAAVGAPR
jgi:glycine oxidase